MDEKPPLSPRSALPKDQWGEFRSCSSQKTELFPDSTECKLVLASLIIAATPLATIVVAGLTLLLLVSVFTIGLTLAAIFAVIAAAALQDD